MVVTFNEADLVSFGIYLLSDKRKKRFQHSYNEQIKQGLNPLSVDESLSEVHHADIANWTDEKSERKLIKKIQAFCEESLDPESFEKWMDVKSVLVKSRKHLSE